MVRSRLVWLVVAIGTVLSLLVQYCVRATLGLENSPETIALLPGVLHLTYLLPYKAFGAFFSDFSDTKQLVIQASILNIVVISAGTFFVSWLLSKSDKRIMKSLQIGVGLLLAGGISKLFYF
jgi:urea transporter